MNARTTFAVGALTLAVVLGLAAQADAGGIVYWGSNTRVIATGTPVVTTTVPAPAVVAYPAATGGAYQAGYADGYRDGVQAAVSPVVTSTYAAPAVAVPTVVYRTTYTVPRTVCYPSPLVYGRILSVPRVRVVRSPYIGRGLHWPRHHRGSSGGLVIRW